MKVAARAWAGLPLALLPLGCAGDSDGPVLQTQNMCGQVVAREVSYRETELYASQEVTLAAGTDALLRFTQECAGAAVTPRPEGPFDVITSVDGPSGLVGGLYHLPRPGTYVFTVTESGVDRSVRIVVR